MILGNSIFQSEVLFNTSPAPATSLPDWTNGDWDDAEYKKNQFGLCCWAFDKREWTYKGYTISQKSMKQERNKIGEIHWFKYGNTITAKNSAGDEIHTIKDFSNFFDVKKYTNANSDDINPDRDSQAFAMQTYLDGLVSPSSGDDDDTDDTGDTDGTTSDLCEAVICSDINRDDHADAEPLYDTSVQDCCGACITGYEEDDNGECQSVDEETTPWILYGGLGIMGLLLLKLLKG